MRRIAVLLALCGSVCGAESQADSAVLAVLSRSDPELVNFKVLQRDAVAEDLDIVLAIGGTKLWSVLGGPLVTWAEKQKLGLFLQEKNQPGRVYQLAVEAGPGNCTVRIDRVTSTDTVLACTGDVQSKPLNHKFIYDVRSKRLIADFSYSPFAIHRGFPNAGGAVFVGSDSQRLIAVAFQPGDDPPFRIVDEAEARPWLARIRTSEGTVGVERKRFLYIQPDEFKPVHFGAFTLDQEAGNSFGPRLLVTEVKGTQTLRYELPQSTYDEFAAARPERVKNGYIRDNTEFDERIGPWQIEDGKLWFGKTFYDGEGMTGVGGFGYFDPADRKFHLFALPQIADWSIAANMAGQAAGFSDSTGSLRLFKDLKSRILGSSFSASGTVCWWARAAASG